MREYTGMDVKLPRAEWLEQYGSRWTWSGLAHFLLPKLQTIRLTRPVILGRACGPAGAFYALREIGAEHGLPLESVKPSDPVAPEIRGRKLVRLWRRLRWIRSDRMPMVRGGISEWVSLVVGLCILVTFAGGLASMCWRVEVGAPLVLTSLLILVPMGIALNRLFPCWPKSIRTYRDLALLVWEHAETEQARLGAAAAQPL